MARTSVSDPTPRSTPPAPPPDPERVRDGNGCGSSLTEAWRPLERGAEALEGVGVPELMEGAGPAPGTRTPRLPGCDPDIPVAPGEEHYVLDPSLDEDSLP